MTQSEDNEPDEAKHRLLMARTADMLAVPSQICLCRACHRAGKCCMILVRSSEPACLIFLLPEERQAFDELLAEVRSVEERMGILPRQPMPADPEACALQEAAIEIIVAALGSHPLNRPHLRRWLRQLQARPTAGIAKGEEVVSGDRIGQGTDDQGQISHLASPRPCR
ncbi:hypothetical protein [Rhizobium sp. BK251]|uniref:hypothetical protein n=1 Tax=Rhizobium sp. BK251 TaxID=2512125 RepID=UPI0010430543|nr:hypothetical protein [Rhizobium sp. BK251]TCL73933.1 hypothetical protein EV286_103467 [Rhizobium sp. BK251]